MFWKARMGTTGLRWAGWFRFVLGVLLLVDLVWLAMDLEAFFHPELGLLPISSKSIGPGGIYSLLRQVKSFEQVQLLWWMGVVAGLLFTLGVAPRFFLVLLYVTFASFHNANRLYCDGIETGLCALERIWMVFLSLIHI